MRILITGNMGYVGPWVTRHLREQHPEAVLIGVDAGYFAHCLTASPRLPETRLDAQYFADVRRLPPGVLEGVDAVVHLAAVSNDPMGAAYEELTLDVNFRAGIDLAREAKAAGVRSFVFASSCSVYGASAGEPRTEQSLVQPLTAYALSKVLAEDGLRNLADPGFCVTCLRFATACGMSDRLRLDLVLNDFVASAITTRRITVLSDGTPWRPLINVEDMARAISWAVDRRPADGGDCLVVNTGSDEWNYRIGELAEAVAAAVPGTVVSVNRDAPPDRRSYRVDFSLFRELAPLHQPQADLIGTVAGLREGLERMRFDDADFRVNAQAIRLKTLSALREASLLSADLAWLDGGARRGGTGFGPAGSEWAASVARSAGEPL